MEMEPEKIKLLKQRKCDPMAVNYQSCKVNRVRPRSLTKKEIIPHPSIPCRLTAWAHGFLKILVLQLIRWVNLDKLLNFFAIDFLSCKTGIITVTAS